MPKIPAIPGDCTSSRVQARLLQAGVGFKGATAEGRENADANPLAPDSEGKPVWTGRAVL